MLVTKEITVSTAHLLSFHEGLCKNLHGHNYRIQITVEGKQKEDCKSSNRMVLDFRHLKAAMKEVIEDNFDHAIIFSDAKYRDEAENELLKWAEKYSMRHFILKGKRTTAEDMGLYIKEAMIESLKSKDLSNITSVNVKIYETETSYIEC